MTSLGRLWRHQRKIFRIHRWHLPSRTQCQNQIRAISDSFREIMKKSREKMTWWQIFYKNKFLKFLESAKMTKGTTSRGTRNDKTHILCRITGRRTYHIQKKRSSVRGRVSFSWKWWNIAPIWFLQFCPEKQCEL